MSNPKIHGVPLALQGDILHVLGRAYPEWLRTRTITAEVYPQRAQSTISGALKKMRLAGLVEQDIGNQFIPNTSCRPNIWRLAKKGAE